MVVSPVMIAGVVLLFTGLVLLGTQLFGHGGVAKSAQFRVLDELLRGAHGTRARSLVRWSLVMLPIGTVLLFTGVALSDQARTERCEAHCHAAGFATARIGPNSDRDPKDRTTKFVACICEGGEGEPLEVDVNELLD